jgi:hypothetical protein
VILTTRPQLIAKQIEARDLLIGIFWQSQEGNPDARTIFFWGSDSCRPNERVRLFGCSPVDQDQAINIPPTQSLLFEDVGFEIEAVMREQNKWGQ